MGQESRETAPLLGFRVEAGPQVGHRVLLPRQHLAEHLHFHFQVAHSARLLVTSAACHRRGSARFRRSARVDAEQLGRVDPVGAPLGAGSAQAPALDGPCDRLDALADLAGRLRRREFHAATPPLAPSSMRAFHGRVAWKGGRMQSVPPLLVQLEHAGPQPGVLVPPVAAHGPAGEDVPAPAAKSSLLGLDGAEARRRGGARAGRLSSR